MRGRSTALTALFLCCAVLIPAQTDDELSVRRFGLFVASNDGGPDRQRLLYADDDVISIARTMGDLGGISPMDEVSLFEPDAAELDRALAELKTVVSGAGGARRIEVFFYYSGHSDDRGLMLGADRFPYGHLRDQLDDLGAQVIVAVLDSCASGAFTRDKGGIRRAPFLVDDSSRMEGHAYLTSSSADEVSQESDAVGGSFFTHYLNSGLRGAADTTGDGRVTLNEIYQHTYAETLARTEQTIGGPQHPAYDIRLTGTGDLVLTDLSRPASAIVFDQNLSGRLAVRDGTGRLVAEIGKRSDDVVTLALPAGSYTMTLQEGHAFYQGEATLVRGRPVTVDGSSFSRVRPETTQSRGGTEEVRDLTFSLGVVPGLSFPDAGGSRVSIQPGFPIAAAGSVQGIQAGLVMATARDGISGAQASGIAAVNYGDLSGVQLAGIYADNAGYLSGAQVSGIFNRNRSDIDGVQMAGIFNLAVANPADGDGTSIRGGQLAGISNHNDGAVEGFQIAGISNRAGRVTGTQVGLVNISDSSEGLLVGLVNISDDMRAFPLGLVNVSRNGITDLDIRNEQGDRTYFSIKTGNRYYYTRFIFGFDDWNFFENPESMVFGFGAGFRATLRPFYLEIDLDGRSAVADYSIYSSTEEAWENVLILPTLSLTLGFGYRWGVYGGVGFTLKTPGMNRESVLLDGGSRWDITADGRWSGVFKWYGGFHF